MRARHKNSFHVSRGVDLPCLMRQRTHHRHALAARGPPVSFRDRVHPDLSERLNNGTAGTALSLGVEEIPIGVQMPAAGDESASRVVAGFDGDDVVGAHDHKQNPYQSQLVMAFTRDDVKALNHDIRALREQTGRLGESHTITTETGKKLFATNDRIRFMRNEHDLGVKNGSLGIVEGIEHGVLTVKLDGTNTHVHVDTKFYKHLDYGYAATVHKAQGTTVDSSYVLASTHFDRHTAYVALSRHRDNATVFYARDDFGGRSSSATDETVRQRFMETLSRARPKELAHDYLERDVGSEQGLVSRLVVSQWEKERNAEARGAKPAHSSTNDLEAKQQAAAERWLNGRGEPSPPNKPTREHDHAPDLEKEKNRERTRGGLEDEL
jgi:Viral (Superfamily 1) RNA helicase